MQTRSAFSSSSPTSPFAMLLLAITILTTVIPGAMVSAQEQQQQRPLVRPPPLMLGRLSSLFDIVKPSPSGGGSGSSSPSPLPSLSLCCGGSCPPGRCDEFQVIHTDLAYAYPAPTAPPTGWVGLRPLALNTKRPCCTPGCADGACRVPQETRSQRPATTPVPPLPPPSEGGGSSSSRTGSHRAKATNTLNIIIGCCRKCKNCDQLMTWMPDVSFAAATVAATPAAAEAAAAAAAAATRLAVRDRDSNDNNKFEGTEPLGPGKDALCLGCGKCYPCEAVPVVEYLTFMPKPSGTPGDDDPGAFAAEDGVVIGGTQRPSSSSSSATSSSTSTSTSSTSNTDPEPTYYIADEINDAINGQNQDILPIIVQSGISSSSTGSSSNGDKKPELITLLATIDFKLQENYISRRMLSELALGDKLQDFPRGATPQVAFLSFHQDKSAINASIVLDLVTGNTAAKTKTLFKNVRFFAFGSDDEQDEASTIIRIPDVILGAKFFREAGGLSVFPAFKTQVEEGVQIVHPVHRGKLGGVRLKAASEGGEEEQRHDEL